MIRLLNTRLKVLESRLSPSPELLTIVRTVVYPDGTQVEIQTLQDKKGNNWQFLPGDTEQVLIDWASRPSTCRSAFQIANTIGSHDLAPTKPV
jgi:hypothetical protein